MKANDSGPLSSYVLVTGANSGIGLATTECLVRSGYRVIAGVHRVSEIPALEERLGESVVALNLDVTNQVSIGHAVERIAELTGHRGLAGLVNNAGIGIGGPIEYADLATLRKQFEVNVFGVVAVISACMPLLRTARGTIINISSMAARVPLPLIGPYSASKAALEAFSDCLRMEIRRSGVKISLVEPGVIDTPMHQKGMAMDRKIYATLPHVGKEFYKTAVAKRFETHETFLKWALPPERVAKVVRAILKAKSPRARYVIGKDAKMFLILKRLLPTVWMDNVLARLGGV